METERLSWYDGHRLFVDGKCGYVLGNYLGGGASGNVYEAVEADTCINYAIKILHPVGYKLCRPSQLSRYSLAVTSSSSEFVLEEEADVHSYEQVESKPSAGTEYQILWLVHPTNRQVIAAYTENGVTKELPLVKCIELWGEDLDRLEKLYQRTQAVAKLTCQPGIRRRRRSSSTAALTSRNSEPHRDNEVQESIRIPYVPEKYINFLRSRRQLCREIHTMSKVGGHVNVLQLMKVLELVQDSKSTLFLVLELANSGELFDRIRVDEGCDEQTACAYFRQVLSGVAYCHARGVCHRDLKPENLLLADQDSGVSVVKIADFGLSALTSGISSDGCSSGKVYADRDPGNPLSRSMKRLVSVVGSPHYVAPEVLQEASQGYDGAKADVWSLGIILYAMLAGNLPFGKDLLQCPRFEEFKRWRRALLELGTPINPYSIPRNTRVPYPGWFFPANLSEVVKSLIVSLLDPNPSSRITVEEAQVHPWMENGVPGHFEVPSTLYPIADEEEEDFSESTFLMNEHVEDSESEEEEEEEEELKKRKQKHSHMFRNAFQSPPLAPVKVHTDSMPDLVLGPLCKSPASSRHLDRIMRRHHRSLSPPRRSKSDDVGVNPAKSFAYASTSNSPPTKATKEVPVFTDIVKRSTRFTTVVPATEVLERIEHIIEDNPYPMKYPYRHIKQQATVDWDLYKLDVTRGGVLMFTVRIFLLRAGLYMVEFIRGQINIFEFKQLYDDIREKLGEIVKNDYTLTMLDASYCT